MTINPDCGWFYRAEANGFEVIPGSPIAYWIGESLSSAFDNCADITSGFSAIAKGIFTGDNARFLRLWWEVAEPDIGAGWVEYAKGGAYRKWYGNVEYVVDWKHGAAELRAFKGSGLGAAQHFGHETITWTKISSGDACFRWNGSEVYFDDASPAFVINSQMGIHERTVLAFLNSSLAQSCLSFLAPTLNYQCGDIRKLPYLATAERVTPISSLVGENILLAMQDWDAFEGSRGFTKHPLA